MKGRLPADIGALVLAALNRYMDDDGSMEQPPRTRPTPTCRRAQALGAMAEASLGANGGGGEAERYVVHVELNSSGEHAPYSPHVRDGGTLSQAAIERLTCDGSLVGHTIDQDGTPLSVGRETRTIPSAIRRALRKRDHGCRFPGCTKSRFVDAHHVQHWAHGGETKLGNLVLLCRHHHRLIHDGEFWVTADHDASGFRFFAAGGEEVPSGGYPIAQSAVMLERDVSAETWTRTPLRPKTYTARPDYGEAVRQLLEGRPPPAW